MKWQRESLCFVFVNLMCSLRNVESVGPWSYFSQPQIVGRFPGYDQNFNIRYFNAPQNVASESHQTDYVFYKNPRAFVPSLNEYPTIASYIPHYNINGLTQQYNPFLRNENTHIGHSSQLHRQTEKYANPLNKTTSLKFSNGPVVFNQNRPYTYVMDQLTQNHYDPILGHIVDNVGNAEKRLKHKEKVPKLEQDVNHPNPHRIKQQNENFQPQYENYHTTNNGNYYKKPQNYLINHDAIAKKIRYPRPNHENIKIHPNSYKPLKKHIKQLRYTQGKKFEDENNEYPENKDTKNNDDRNNEQNGHDIFDRQKLSFSEQNDDFHDKFNQFTDDLPVLGKVIPSEDKTNEKNGDSSESESEEFVPVKMYAQVRHTETTKHLPREAAYEDAKTYDEVLNAPRLRESIKTSKAQTVYTEEGYEDNAYDHAGHLKHASNHEGYGGYSQDKKDADSLYKEGDISAHKDGGISKYGSDSSRGKSWSTDKGKFEDFDDQSSFNLTDRNSSKDGDLIEAGSEKKSANNTSSTPKDKTNIKKITMTARVEKKYEDIIRMSDGSNEKSIRPISQNENRSTEQIELLYDDSVDNNNRKINKNQSNYNHHKFNDSKSINIQERFRIPISRDVEIFNTDFKMNVGPKHGGNYKVHPMLYKYPKTTARNNFNREPHLPKKTIDIQSGRYKKGYDKLYPMKHNRLFNLNTNYDKNNLYNNHNNDAVNLSEISLGKIVTTSKDISDKLINSTSRSQKLLQWPINKSTHVVDELASFQNTRITTSTPKSDQFPVNSEIEVFRSDFRRNVGPKHGGNYKKKNIETRKQGQSELEDLNGPEKSSGVHLHGGNYKAESYEEIDDEEDNDDDEEPLVVADLPSLSSNNTSSPIS